jgi:hypothetical protein
VLTKALDRSRQIGDPRTGDIERLLARLGE